MGVCRVEWRAQTSESEGVELECSSSTCYICYILEKLCNLFKLGCSSLKTRIIKCHELVNGKKIICLKCQAHSGGSINPSFLSFPCNPGGLYYRGTEGLSIKSHHMQSSLEKQPV